MVPMQLREVPYSTITYVGITARAKISFPPTHPARVRLIASLRAEADLRVWMRTQIEARGLQRFRCGLRVTGRVSGVTADPEMMPPTSCSLRDLRVREARYLGGNRGP